MQTCHLSSNYFQLGNYENSNNYYFYVFSHIIMLLMGAWLNGYDKTRFQSHHGGFIKELMSKESYPESGTPLETA